MSCFCDHCNAAFPSECKCGKIGLYKNWSPTIQKLQAENKKLRECVEFYAYDENCIKLKQVEVSEFSDHFGYRINIDKGERAEQCLKELEGEK